MLELGFARGNPRCLTLHNYANYTLEYYINHGQIITCRYVHTIYKSGCGCLLHGAPHLIRRVLMFVN